MKTLLHKKVNEKLNEASRSFLDNLKTAESFKEILVDLFDFEKVEHKRFLRKEISFYELHWPGFSFEETEPMRFFNRESKSISIIVTKEEVVLHAKFNRATDSINKFISELPASYKVGTCKEGYTHLNMPLTDASFNNKNQVTLLMKLIELLNLRIKVVDKRETIKDSMNKAFSGANDESA